LKRSDKYDTCDEWFKQIFSPCWYDIAVLRDPADDVNFEEYDLVYIGGGNTYSLIYDLRENDLVQPLLEYAGQGGVVYGGSAGAIILGEHIGTAVGDENYVDIDDFDALALIHGYDFRPHHTTEHRDAVTEHIEEAGNPVMCCPEPSGVRLKGDEATIIGEKPVILRHGNREIRLQPDSTVDLGRLHSSNHLPPE